jgi:hypothetical protein
MKHVVRSFITYTGRRGVHFYDEVHCNFLTWQEVINVLSDFPQDKEDSFADRLLDSLSNYNPDYQFLAVQQNGNNVSVQLFADQSRASMGSCG